MVVRILSHAVRSSSSSSYSYLKSRDLSVLQIPLDQFLGDGLPAALPSLRWSSGCSFPYWFPFKCDAWQSSLFHSSHVSVPHFSMSCTPHCSLMSVFLIRSIYVFPIIVLSVFISATRSILFVFFGFFSGFYSVSHDWPDTSLLDSDLTILSHVFVRPYYLP